MFGMEKTWRCSADPGFLIAQIACEKEPVADRKLILALLACLRSMQDGSRWAKNVTDDVFLSLVEGYADGVVDASDLRRGWHACKPILLRNIFETTCGPVLRTVTDAFRMIKDFVCISKPNFPDRFWAMQANAIRDVFGTIRPWHGPSRRPGPDALAVAWAIYDGGTWNETSILADALEDDGVVDPLLLGHLRGLDPCQECFGQVWPWVGASARKPAAPPFLHWRGCWAVDWVLDLGRKNPGAEVA